MSGICGWVGEADRPVLDAMLAAIDYRGDSIDTAHAPGVALGYRWWKARPGKSPGIHREGSQLVACAGTFAPSADSPAAAFVSKLTSDHKNLDGAFAAAWWDGDRRRLTLARDPFGVRSLYYTTHRGVFYFASEIKQLLGQAEMTSALNAQGLDAATGTPQSFDQFIRAEIDKWRKVVQAANIKVE